MKITDFHCDTLMRLYDLKSKNDREESFWENRGQIDLKRLLKSGYASQFFACFLWLEGTPVKENFFEDALCMADILYEAERDCPESLKVCRDFAEYKEAVSAGKVAAFLTIEEGGIIDGRPERLEELYKKGIRLITLTWNFENCLGFPNIGFKYQNEGLKKFGIETLERMDELGIIADVSHLSDGGFYDIVRYGRRPFVASHSNARSIRLHPRNLTDEMIKLLAQKGGIAGLNFCGDFLSDDGKSTTEAMIAHIRHFMKIGGKEIIAIGTDFDGIEDAYEIKECGEMYKFVEALERAGFSTEEIENICYKNAERFFERYWGE